MAPPIARRRKIKTYMTRKRMILGSTTFACDWEYTSQTNSCQKGVEDLKDLKGIKEVKRNSRPAKKSVQVPTGTPILKLSPELHHLIFANLGGVAAMCVALTCRQLYLTHSYFLHSLSIPADWNHWHQNPTNLMAFDLLIAHSKPRLHRLLEVWMGDQYKFCQRKEKFIRVDVE